MTKRKKQAIILLALSAPMMWFGFTSFMAPAYIMFKYPDEPEW